ncbi:MAG: hypothetical protein ACYCW6_05295, partial [Candidatus Xenobia bacterium]
MDVNDLVARGVRLEKLHRTWLLKTRWDGASPAEAERLADHGRLRAALPQHDPVSVQGKQDLENLDTFLRDPKQLPNASLATSLVALEQDGARFSSGGQNIGAWGAWNWLTGSPHGWDAVHYTFKGTEGTLQSPEDPYLLQYLEQGQGGAELCHPRTAQALRETVQSGYQLDRPAIDTYRQGHGGAISLRGTLLEQAAPADLEDPARLATELTKRHHDLAAVRAAFPADRADAAWAVVRDHEGAQPVAERIHLLDALYKSGTTAVQPLYNAAIDAADWSVARKHALYAAYRSPSNPLPIFQAPAPVPALTEDAMPALARLANAASWTMPQTSWDAGKWTVQTGGSMQSPPLFVEPGRSELTFNLTQQTWYYGSKLDVSTDGGKTWQAAGVFSRGLKQAPETVDLSAWQGQSVVLRFTPPSDAGATLEDLSLGGRRLRPDDMMRQVAAI